MLQAPAEGESNEVSAHVAVWRSLGASREGARYGVWKRQWRSAASRTSSDERTITCPSQRAAHGTSSMSDGRRRSGRASAEAQEPTRLDAGWRGRDADETRDEVQFQAARTDSPVETGCLSPPTRHGDAPRTMPRRAGGLAVSLPKLGGPPPSSASRAAVAVIVLCLLLAGSATPARLTVTRTPPQPDARSPRAAPPPPPPPQP